MDKATKLYQEIIDKLADMSKSCVNAGRIEQGSVPGDDSADINAVLGKLNENDRAVLARFVTETYSSGIFDVLDLLEWYTSSKGMTISIGGEQLPTDKFEGIQNDFIGRRDGWDWYDE